MFAGQKKRLVWLEEMEQMGVDGVQIMYNRKLFGHYLKLKGNHCRLFLIDG